MPTRGEMALPVSLPPWARAEQQAATTWSFVGKRGLSLGKSIATHGNFFVTVYVTPQNKI